MMLGRTDGCVYRGRPRLIMVIGYRHGDVAMMYQNNKFAVSNKSSPGRAGGTEHLIW
jgi:hypothetical protein